MLFRSYSFDHENLNFSKRKDKQNIYRKRKFSAEISKCLEIFNFKDEFNEKELKKRYKELVKKYHPDLNKNFLNKENNIKEINKSYSKLMKFLQK